LRKKRPYGSFTVHTTALLAIEMLKGIKSIHEIGSGKLIGILHRDIKPGNFCITDDIQYGCTRPGIFIIDFGLSRRFMNPNGSVREVIGILT
jgi:tau tubulin kinase